MRDVFRVVAIGGYVLLGIVASWRGRTAAPASARRTLNIFLIYTLLVSFGAGLLQKDLWPFTTWPLVAAIYPAVAQEGRVVVLDRDGRERDVDARAWHPFVAEELFAWSFDRLMKLPHEDQQRAGAYLLGLVQRSAEHAARGDGVGSLNRVWGPLTAPSFLLHPKIWDAPGGLPQLPLTGLRFYRVTWNLEARLHNPDAVERTLLLEYRRP